MKPRNVGVAGFFYKTANAQAKAVFLFLGLMADCRFALPRGSEISASVGRCVPLSKGLWISCVRERSANGSVQAAAPEASPLPQVGSLLPVGRMSGICTLRPLDEL